MFGPLEIFNKSCLCLLFKETNFYFVPYVQKIPWVKLVEIYANMLSILPESIFVWMVKCWLTGSNSTSSASLGCPICNSVSRG